MIDYSNACNVDVGKLACGFMENPSAESDVEEAASLFNTAMSRKSYSGIASPYRVRRDHVDAVRKRVEVLQSKGWLSQQEYRKFMGMLDIEQKEKMSHFTNHMLKELEKDLDNLEKNMENLLQQSRRKPAVAVAIYPHAHEAAAASKTFDSQPPSSVCGLSKSMTFSKPGGPSKDLPHYGISMKTSNQFRPPSTNSNVNNNGSKSIVTPQELSGNLSEEEISELFVETCFFARLGFVQPPCCLQCTYRESMKEDTPNMFCGRWVIWRRYAKKILHPSDMDENTLVVQCHAARKLIAGKLVEQHKWDKVNKILLQPRTAQMTPAGLAAKTSFA